MRSEGSYCIVKCPSRNTRSGREVGWSPRSEWRRVLGLRGAGSSRLSLIISMDFLSCCLAGCTFLGLGANGIEPFDFIPLLASGDPSGLNEEVDAPINFGQGIATLAIGRQQNKVLYKRSKYNKTWLGKIVLCKGYRELHPLIIFTAISYGHSARTLVV